MNTGSNQHLERCLDDLNCEPRDEVCSYRIVIGGVFTKENWSLIRDCKESWLGSTKPTPKKLTREGIMKIEIKNITQLTFETI